MADRPDIASLFTPEPHSAALIFLRRLIGCTFDHVWMPGGGAGGVSASCNNSNDILPLVVTTLNWGMLAVISVVATWLIFAALKDTANDGKAGGNAMNPSWTLVLTGVAAILCFPAFGGFSALQVGTMQVAVWSSGLGDSMWRVAGDKMASTNTVNAAFVSPSSEGWFSTDPGTEKALREQIAEGLVTRVAGELCRTAISHGVSTMATIDGGIETVTPPPTVASIRDGYVQTVLTYRAGRGLNDSAGLCGSVAVSYSTKLDEAASTKVAANLSPASAGAQTSLVNTAANFKAQAAKASADALLVAIRTEGDNLYRTLFPANSPRLQGSPQLAAVETAVTNSIERSREAAQAALKNAPSEFTAITRSAMAGNQKNGWFYAVLYQRVLVNATSALSNLGFGGMEVVNNRPAANLAGAFNCGGWLSPSCSAQLDVFFGNYKRDLEALAEIEPSFRNAAQGSSTQGVNSTTIGNPAAGGLSLSKAANDVMLWIAGVGSAESEGWVDPITQLQGTGASIMSYGAGVLAAATAGDAVAAFAPHPGLKAAGELASLLAPLGWVLLGIGFMLAVVVPYMPLVYFLLAALSWLILALQSIFAAPFWLMKAFYPNRSGSLSGTSFAQLLNVLLALLMKPALIVLGFVFCMIFMRVCLDILQIFASNAFNVLSFSASSLTAGVGNMALAVGGFFVYASLCVAIVSVSCGLIDGVSEFAMDNVEAGLSRFMGSERNRSDNVLGNPGTAAAAGLAIGSRRSGNLAGTFKQLESLRGAGSPQKKLAGSR